MYKFVYVSILGFLLSMLIGSAAFAAEFVCLDVPEKKWSKEEQRNIDLFWNDTLAYLEAYVKALETPTGKCLDSAEAVVSTYNSETGKPETECITKKRDVELMIKHVKAVLAEPEKAKRCFDPQLSHSNGWTKLFTPNRELQNSSPVSKWLNRPVATDYFEKTKDPEIKKAGLELNKNFVEIASNTDSSAHFGRDITIKGLPHLWSSVGWIPFYAESEKAWNKDIRGGYLYAEIMGPWGNLRIDTIDGETVGSEIGMTAQLNNSSYPVHFHHPQEIYMTLTTPEHPKQNQFLLLDWDSDQFQATRAEDGFDVEVKGESKWEDWYMSADPKDNWLIYLERNALHAFYAGDEKNADLENSGWVSVWARTTARDNNQTTQISVPADKNTKRIVPATHVHAHTKRWEP
ncbi:dimethylsulfonioproprionate lyase family protein [Maridesulfovibrio sp.]|uniref:dimethylsulfonioproprionate lyase family protein n=1 Tax=Maridesulfovibrio sp. TaxID=2795000 RepID=UPI003BABECF2